MGGILCFDGVGAVAFNDSILEALIPRTWRSDYGIVWAFFRPVFKPHSRKSVSGGPEASIPNPTAASLPRTWIDLWLKCSK